VFRSQGRESSSGPRLPGKWLTISLFLAPALVVYLVFVIIPIIQAAHFSLYKWNGLGPLEDFIGLANYQVALASEVFWQAVGNNVLVIVLSLLLQIPFSLGLAILLNRRFPGRAIFRLLFFVPYVLSEAITGIVFSLLLQPDALVDSGLKGIGLEGLIQDWLGNTDIVMLVMNEKGMRRLLDDKVTLGAEATVAAGPVGRQTSANTDVQLSAEMLSWSRSKGLFAGIALHGATMRPDNDVNQELYGSKMSNKEILTGSTKAPAGATGLVTALNRYSPHEDRDKPLETQGADRVKK